MDSNTKSKLKNWLINGQVDKALAFIEAVETTGKTRTPSQNSAFHLWLNMIEKEAENKGVTWDMLIRHTSQLRVTSEGLKSAVKDLIKALWGYTSTTQLKKQGDIDIVIDHMTDWLSKEMEVPEFPSRLVEDTTLKNIERASKIDYPENNLDIKL